MFNLNSALYKALKTVFFEIRIQDIKKTQTFQSFTVIKYPTET